MAYNAPGGAFDVTGSMVYALIKEPLIKCILIIDQVNPVFLLIQRTINNFEFACPMFRAYCSRIQVPEMLKSWRCGKSLPKFAGFKIY